MLRKCLPALSLFFITCFGAAAMNIPLSEFQNKWSGTFTEQKSGSITRSYQAYVQGADLPSYIEKTFEEPISLDRKFVRVKFRVNELSKLSGMELRLTSQAQGYSDFFAIPIPLFTDRDFNTVQDNAWIEYTFTMGEVITHGNPDINNIVRLGFYLGGNEVKIDFRSIEIEEAHFESVVSFTWDDGYDDHFLAAQIMGKYGINGTAYLMPRQIGLKNYLTQEQVHQMEHTYDWGISSHHKIPIVDFTYPALSKEMDYTIEYLTSIFNVSQEEVAHFAYPLGKQSRVETLPLIRQKFRTARLAGGGAETLPPGDWHMLRAFNVMPHISPQELIERVKKAREQGEWLILMFHYLSEEKNPENPLSYNIEKFEEFCRLIKEEGSLVLPVHQVYEAFEL